MKKALLIAFVALSFIASAQDDEDRFRLILSGGLVATQVDGDSYAGYNKLGPYGGLYLSKPLGERTFMNFGLTYVQKGAKVNASATNYNYYRNRLNYVEVPFMISGNYKVKYRFEGGLSFAYMFKKNEYSTQVGTINTPVKSIDFCYNLGFGYNFSPKLFVNLRYNYSLLPIRDYAPGVYLGPNFFARYFNRGLYNNVLQLTLNYTINPKARNGD